MKQKNTKELDDILGKTHISDFDKFCVEQKGSMDPEQNAFSEYIKDLLKEKRITQQMVFLKADIPEKYGYKLLSGEKHTRQRDIILRICYAAELTLEQTQRALRKYEMPQLYAKIPRDALLSQPRIKNDGLCFDITDEIVVDVNIAFLVIVHGIALADLNFLNQAHQRGTV